MIVIATARVAIATISRVISMKATVQTHPALVHLLGTMVVVERVVVVVVIVVVIRAGVSMVTGAARGIWQGVGQGVSGGQAS